MAVVGCGRIGAAMEADNKRIRPATHAGAFAHNPDTELVALVEVNPEQGRAARALFPQVPSFESLEKMLAETRPDVVCVATPPSSHRPVVETCARFGVRGLVCEKPVADTLENAEAIVRVCRETNTLLWINHTRRFDPLLSNWRREVVEGRLGKILGGSAFCTAGLYNSGTHLVDLLRYYLGDVEKVMALDAPGMTCPPGDRAVNGALVFSKDVFVGFHHLEVKDYAHFEVRLFGQKGCLSLDRFGFEVELMPVRECVDFSGYKELDVDTRARHGKSRSFMVGLAEHVVEGLRTGVPPRSRGEDGVEALRVLTAMSQSASAQGRWVDVSTVRAEVSR